MEAHEALKALGSGNTEYRYDNPTKDVLETFTNPMAERGMYDDRGGIISIRVPEFTSLCPKTGQPDFAEIRIQYEPRDLCVESKSLKLYLMQYRNHGSFHEAIVQQITDDLIDILEPRWLEVEGRFTPRGGISFWPKREHWGA